MIALAWSDPPPGHGFGHGKQPPFAPHLTPKGLVSGRWVGTSPVGTRRGRLAKKRGLLRSRAPPGACGALNLSAAAHLWLYNLRTGVIYSEESRGTEWLP